MDPNNSMHRIKRSDNEYLQAHCCLDVMHIEKNVCESLIALMLNTKGKSKDGVSVREDDVDDTTYVRSDHDDRL